MSRKRRLVVSRRRQTNRLHQKPDFRTTKREKENKPKLINSIERLKHNQTKRRKHSETIPKRTGNNTLIRVGQNFKANGKRIQFAKNKGITAIRIRNVLTKKRKLIEFLLDNCLQSLIIF